MSQGAIGGGIAVALARALRAGRLSDAVLIAWCAVLVAIGFDILTTAVMLTLGAAFVLYCAEPSQRRAAHSRST